MMKYTFVVLAKGREEFLRLLQGLGMVDVTVTDWEPSEADRALMAAIDEREKAVEYLSAASGPTSGKGETSNAQFQPAAGGDGGLTNFHESSMFEAYKAARENMARLDDEIVRETKAADEVRPWGDFDPVKIKALLDAGVDREWLLGGDEVSSAGDFSRNYKQVEDNIEKLQTERAHQEAVLARVAVNKGAIEAEIENMKDRLQFSRAAEGGELAADDTLVVMEAWARESQQAEVEAMVGGVPNVIYIKDRPTPEDDTPVELKNSRFASPFEFIADLYAKPRYGTMDLTRWLAPFYMLFFGFCLADAGYGALIMIAGIFLVLKGSGAMKTIGKLSVYCGAAATVFGFFAGSLFGIDIKAWPLFAGLQKIFFTSDTLFAGALGIGVLQILFAMTLKAITTARAFGIKYALSTIGWIVVIVTGLAMMVPEMMGIDIGISRSVFYVLLGVGGAMMLFLNNPGKNIFVNFGGGLWNTYNDITGLLSDALSYIRLFAIGLSGGVLAAVFNDLAFGLSPDIPVVGQLVTLIILLIGHGLNLFMSTLSSMVHPLRLTFVEFYKNAGFEAAGRKFNPLKSIRR